MKSVYPFGFLVVVMKIMSFALIGCTVDRPAKNQLPVFVDRDGDGWSAAVDCDDTNASPVLSIFDGCFNGQQCLIGTACNSGMLTCVANEGDSKGVCRCLDERRTGPVCERCVNDRFVGLGCDECAPRFAGADCTECAPGFSGDSCMNCADARFTGENCDECADPKFTGANCDECADQRFTGVECNECLPGFTGSACRELENV